MFIPNTEENRKMAGVVEIPCGKCVGCRLDYSRLWANRCKAETQYHEQNWFLTITYDEANLPYGRKGNPTLFPDHISQFMKVLRKKFGDGIKFFCCGEYGGQTFRPHYHMILFGAKLDDLTEWFPMITEEGKKIVITKKSKSGNRLFYSPSLQECWKKGEIQVGDVSWNSCEYVARYVMKKASPEYASNVYDMLGIEKEFLRMSRRPGIGYQYYQDRKSTINLTDEVYLPGKDGAIRSSVSGYWKKLKRKDMDEDGCVDYQFDSLHGFINAKDHVESLEKLSGISSIDRIRENQEEHQKLMQKILTRD